MPLQPTVVTIAVTVMTSMAAVIHGTAAVRPIILIGIVGIGTVDGTGPMVGSSFREKPQIPLTTLPHP